MSKAGLIAVMALPTVLVCSLCFAARPDAGAFQSREEEGVTELMRAARDGERQNVKALLKQGVDVNARDGSGWAALTYAAAKGDRDIVKALISKGADINATDRGGDTPLIAAVRYHNVSVVRMLIEKGVDVNDKDKSGSTAMATAIRSRQDKMIEILKKAGAVQPQAAQTKAPVTPTDSVDSGPVLLNNPRPIYTTKARDELVAGIVRLRVLIGKTGTVSRVRILTGLPYGLSYRAMDAAYQMVFTPAKKDGQPVAFWKAVEIEFNLR